jgi:protein gp37
LTSQSAHSGRTGAQDDGRHGTRIGWTHGPGYTGETWNPTVGCDKVSPGCGLPMPGADPAAPHGNCYACGVAQRAMTEAHVGLTIKRPGEPVDWNGTVHLLPERLDQPLGWTKPRMVFVDSMSDLFHPEIPTEFIADVFAVMALAERHVFQVLTKRPKRMALLTVSDGFVDDVDGARMHRRPLSLMPDWPRPNIWLGTSIEGDDWVWRADALRASSAAIRFLSCEPLLGPMPSIDLTDIDWVLIGGESGPGARRMDPAWASDLIDRCAADGVACYMKQAGTVLAREWGMSDSKGTDVDEMPPSFRVREWPHVNRG